MTLEEAIYIVENEPTKYALGYDIDSKLILVKDSEGKLTPNIFYDFSRGHD